MLLISLIFSSCTLLLMNIRMAVGRTVFPCGVYLLSLMCFASCVSTPYFLMNIQIFSKFKVQHIMSRGKKVRLSSTEESLKEEGTTNQKCDLSIDNGLLDERFSNCDLRLLKIFKFLHCRKFKVMTMLGFVALQFALWLTLGLIEKYFQVEYHVGFKFFSSPCAIGSNTVIIMASCHCFYSVLVLCSAILSFFADNDTWSIKKEMVVMTICQLLCDYLFNTWTIQHHSIFGRFYCTLFTITGADVVHSSFGSFYICYWCNSE